MIFWSREIVKVRECQMAPRTSKAEYPKEKLQNSVTYSVRVINLQVGVRHGV